MYLSELDRTSTAYTNTQQTLSTGKRINQVSDDPVGAVSAINMTALNGQLAQYSSNLSQAKDWYSFTDNALSQTNTILNSAYTLALNAANGTVDQTARNAMITQISDMESTIVNQANSQGPQGQYVFAGQKTDTQPFSAANGKLTYSGDSGSISVETGPADQMVVNSQGGPLYTSIYNQLESLKSHLASGSTSGITNTDLAAIKASIGSVNDVRGRIGAQLQTVANLTTDNTQRQQEFTKSISDVTDADMAQATLQFTQAQTAYQAALTTIGQANKFSLMDFIQ
jgi:flagellar hook-associated protein 3 FlgL